MTQALGLRHCLGLESLELFGSFDEFQKSNPFTPSFKFPDHSPSTSGSGQENTTGISGLEGVRNRRNNKQLYKGGVNEYRIQIQRNTN